MLLDERTFTFFMDIAATLVAGGADDEHATWLQAGAVAPQRRFILQDVLHHVHAHHQLKSVRALILGHIAHLEADLWPTDALEEGIAVGHLFVLHIDGRDVPLGREAAQPIGVLPETSTCVIDRQGTILLIPGPTAQFPLDVPCPQQQKVQQTIEHLP